MEEEEDFFDEMDENSHADGDVAGDDALDEYEMLTKVTDTSAAQARKEKDIQGIQWDRLNISRDSCRVIRLEQYKNYENIHTFGDAVNEDCKRSVKGGKYYDFFYNTRMVKPTILHFQVCLIFHMCFLEESHQLMRLPPWQSIAEADLMVPFQLLAWSCYEMCFPSSRMPSYGITVRPSLLDVSSANTLADGSSGA
ncbi:hypothetical protein HN51_015755 [Arachis hypogaea]